MNNEMSDADIERLARKMVEMQGLQAARSKGLPDTLVRDVWVDFEQALARGEVGGKTRRNFDRKDHKVIAGHKDWILDLPFKLNEAVVTLGNMPFSSLSGDVGEAWREQFRRTEKKAYDCDPKVKAYVFPSELSDMGRKGYVRPSGMEAYYSPAYINRVMASFNTFVTWRVKHRVNSPLRGIGLLETDDDVRAGCFFEDEKELEEFLQCAHPTLQLMGRLSATTGGMRKAEVRQLQTDWVLWDHGVIRLPEGITKNGKSREFPVQAREMEMLRSRRSLAEGNRSQLLFSNPHDADHGLIPDGTLDDWVQIARERWGKLLNGVHEPIFHAFRHTWATWAGAQGCDAMTIMRLGGWSSHAVAMRYVQMGKASFAQVRALTGRPVSEIHAEAEEEIKRQGRGRLLRRVG